MTARVLRLPAVATGALILALAPPALTELELGPEAVAAR